MRSEGWGGGRRDGGSAGIVGDGGGGCIDGEGVGGMVRDTMIETWGGTRSGGFPGNGGSAF